MFTSLAMVVSLGGRAQSAGSECQARLTADHVGFRPLGAISGPGECGGPDIVLLERLGSGEKGEIQMDPPATMRCEMAEATVRFIRQDIVPTIAAMGSALRVVQNLDSYDCRGRNRVPGARMSEHGRANALDIRAFRLADGRVFRPTETTTPALFRQTMKTAVCARFSTVLGPGSDGYHEDHIHIDLAPRASGRHYCHWEMRDVPQTVVAAAKADISPSGIPLPRARPSKGAGRRGRHARDRGQDE